MQRQAVQWKFTNVSEARAASIFMLFLPPASSWLFVWQTLRPWRWIQYVPPKSRWTSTEPKTVVFNWNIPSFPSLCLPPAFTLASFLIYSSTLKIETICSSEISVGFQRITRRYILPLWEPQILHYHRSSWTNLLQFSASLTSVLALFFLLLSCFGKAASRFCTIVPEGNETCIVCPVHLFVMSYVLTLLNESARIVKLCLQFLTCFL
jgi:hypothetical protein